MPVCVHQIGITLRKQQQLHHPDPVETQIQIGNSIKPLELFQWTTGHLEGFGPIHPETLVFLIQQSERRGEASDVINDVALIVDEKLRHFTANRFGRFISGDRIQDFCDRVSGTFWIRVSDPTDITAGWAQVSFYPFVFGLARDLLKKERFENERFIPQPAGPNTDIYESTASDPLSLDNGLLVRELLQFLTPAQKQVFVCRHYYGLTVAQIALEVGRSERTVHYLLKTARIRLRQVMQ